MPKRINPIDRVMEYFETAPTQEATIVLGVAQGLIKRRIAATPVKRAAVVRAMIAAARPTEPETVA